LVGSGNFLNAAQRQIEKLGLGNRVNFKGRLPRDEVLKIYPEYDVFVFPSLHDTGGYAVIEAMFNELPVICLDCGGPAVAVRDGCGTKVPLGSRTRVVQDLAMAIRLYDHDREFLLTQGRTSRAVILEQYDWDKKGQEMNQRYQRAVTRNRSGDSGAVASRRYSGIGSFTNLVHRLLSLRGLAVSLFGLLLVGATGFVSVGHLKQQAGEIVNDTLPGLTYAGEANACLAQAFNRTLIFLITDDPAQRAVAEKDIEVYSARTTFYLAAYDRQIYEAPDRANFLEMQRRRAEYARVRDQTVSLAKQNKKAEAIACCKTQLLPAYSRYKDAGDKLFEYNIREGRTRGRTIMQVCTVTQFVVGGIGILIFLAGFMIGISR
jgi:hypothetical protein